MDTKLVRVPEFTGGYDRTLGEADKHRVNVPEFIDTVIQRNYANLPFYLNEGIFKVTANGILHGDRLLYSFDSPLTEEVTASIRAAPLKLFIHLDPFDSSVFGTVNGQELECRAWLDYLVAQSRGEIKSEKTYQMEPDSLGRILIPKEVRDELGIVGTVSVLLMGMTNHFTLTKRRELKITSYRR